MKAITILQPYASLLVKGIKRYETRSWSTEYWGEMALHAGKAPYDAPAEVHDFVNAAMEIDSVSELPMGYVLGAGNLVACHPIDDDFAAALDETELSLGDFSAGRYAWEFADIVEFEEPVRANGKQRIWEWDSPGEASDEDETEDSMDETPRDSDRDEAPVIPYSDNARPLSIKSAALSEASDRYDAILCRTVDAMIKRRADSGEVTLKLKVNLEEDGEDEDVIRPNFEYKVSAIIAHKASVDGKMRGNYELVRTDDGYGLQEITYGQTSFYDRPAQEGDGITTTVDDSGNVVQVEFPADTEGECQEEAEAT